MIHLQSDGEGFKPRAGAVLVFSPPTKAILPEPHGQSLPISGILFAIPAVFWENKNVPSLLRFGHKERGNKQAALGWGKEDSHPRLQQQPSTKNLLCCSRKPHFLEASNFSQCCVIVPPCCSHADITVNH